MEKFSYGSGHEDGSGIGNIDEEWECYGDYGSGDNRGNYINNRYFSSGEGNCFGNSNVSFGSGDVDGTGYGRGDGSGYGSGYGNEYGMGNGSGDGNGNGNNDGTGICY